MAGDIQKSGGSLLPSIATIFSVYEKYKKETMAIDQWDYPPAVKWDEKLGPITWDNLSIEPEKSGFNPIDYTNIQKAASIKQEPNKVAQRDTKWANKVAWSSDELLARQQSLATYSMEVNTIFEIIKNFCEKVTGGECFYDDLDFVANFGSPIYDDTQVIVISISQPIVFKSFRIIYKLKAGQLIMSFNLDITDTTPQRIREIYLKDDKEIDIKKLTSSIMSEEKPKIRPDRKVTI